MFFFLNVPCWRSKSKHRSDVLQWIPSHWLASEGRQARTYPQQFSRDKGCSLEDLPGAIQNRDRWGESLANPFKQHETMVVLIVYRYLQVNHIWNHANKDGKKEKWCDIYWRFHYKKEELGEYLVYAVTQSKLGPIC